MALVLKDRVKETSTTAGTGTITLAGAVAGFQSFAAVGNGNTTYYAIVDPTTGDWEVGIGTYTSSGTTLSRDTVLSSSNSGSLVNFVANQKDVFVTYPSEKSVYEDASNVVNATSFGAITATSAALTTGTVSTAPASGTDIANKTYVDTLVSSGITYHTPVKYEVPDTTGNLNATYNNGASGVGATLTNAGTLVAFTPDGTVATAGDRIIIYNQTNQFENGIYTVTTVGSGSVAWVLTRATDADTYALKSPNGLGNGDAFFITSGATGAGETYVCNTAGVITFGTTAITFAQISDSTLYTAGTGLTLTGTEFSITPTGTAGTYGSASSVPVLTTNASGQVTSVTNTTIAINGSQVSGNISGSAGSVANALTLGTYLTGTSFNGSAAVTATVDATSANTASKVVARDSNGDFSAGTITATLNGTATSTASATNLSGGAANQIAYQSAANTTAFATAPSASNQVLNWNGSAFTWSAGTISGVPLGSNLNSLTAGTYLTGTAYNGSAAQTWAVDATSANTASKVVARDASGNFSAGTITATLNGSASSASTSTTQSKTDASTNIATTAFSKWMFATTGTGGTLDWDDSSNTIPGVGTTLLLGTATNGPGGSNYYHPFNIEYSGITGAGNVTQMAIAYGAPANELYMRGRYSGSWTGWVRYLNSNNYNSYAPTLTGTGASGTWNINVTGSAGSAGSATTAVTLTSTQSNWNSTGVASNVVGLLGWKNYGNNHVIFDASNSTTPSGTSCSNTNPTYAWGATYPTLMGWNGSATYGVRVDRSYQTDYLYSSTGAYATIYYDTDNTGYYLDPNSTSVISTLRASTIQHSNSNTAIGLNSVTYLQLFDPSGSVRAYLGNSNDPGNYYDNTTHYFRNNSSVVKFTINDSYGQHVSSLRAPIFYDSDDTGYYGNFAGLSRMLSLGLGNQGDLTGGVNALSLYSNSRYLEALRYSGSEGYYPWLVNDYANGVDALIFHFNGIGDQFSFGRTGIGQAGGSFRAPVFYDSNDTGYYVDPASVSNLATVNTQNAVSNITGGLRNVMPGGGAYTTSASSVSGAIVVRLPTNLYPMIRFTVKVYTYDGLSFDINCGGHTSSGTWYNTFAWMATQHRPAMNVRFTYDGTYVYVYIGDLGSSWSYPQVFITDVQVGYGVTDYSYWDDGWSISFNTSTYNSISATHTVYPPTSTGNNTNPAYASIYYDANNTSYYVDPSSASNMSLIYADNWFRSIGVTGLYSQSYAQHFYPDSNGRYWSITGNGSTDYGGLLFRTTYESTLKGYVYWDTNGFGLLHGGGGWSVRGNLSAVGGQFYGSWFSDTDLRAPIFYDYNNTSYYLDPASSSVLNTIYQVGVYTRNSAGTGYLSGNYASSETWTTTGAIYTIGGSYYPTSSSFNTMYGIGYCYADGISVGISGASSWGMYVNASGANNVWLGGATGQVISTGDHRGTIFYDYNNTGYYVDPASTSILNVLNCYGNVTAYYSSDIKFKTNVRDIPNAIETVESIGGKLFDWTDEYLEEHGGEDPYFMRKEDFGVVAQDVLKVFPVAVRTRPDGSLAVDYEKLSALAFAAVAELSTRVKSLEARI